MGKSVLNLLSLKYIWANQVEVQLVDMRLWSSEYISKLEIQILEKAQGVKKSTEHKSRDTGLQQNLPEQSGGNQGSVTNHTAERTKGMWKVTLLFSRSTLSSKLLKTSYDSLVLKMHAQGKGAGRAEEPGSRRSSGGGFPPALPGGARPRRRRPRPRPGPPVPGRSSSFKGRRAPLAGS